MNNDEKVYIVPGSIVSIAKDVSNKPKKMLVTEKVVRTYINKEGKKDSVFVGLRCRWFTSDGALQEAIFSTKDLKLIE